MDERLLCLYTRSLLFLKSKHGSLALDPVKHTRIVNRDVLLRNDLDNFLRDEAAGKGGNVV